MIFQIGASGKRGFELHFVVTHTHTDTISVDISPISKSLPAFYTRRHFFFIIFQHSRWQMYLCPRAHCAFHLSSLQAEHLYTSYPLGFAPFPSLLLWSHFLSPHTPPSAPAGVPPRLYFATHSTSSSFVSFPPACLICDEREHNVVS